MAGSSLKPERNKPMARKTIFVSDLSGKPIAEGADATITIRFADARKGVYVLDVTEDEAEELGRKGRKQARRGRRPKTAS
jgi:nitrous oxide reductase accessory protein NosL